MKKRAAVLIGVNKTGGLPFLEACANGAIAVAEWLDLEGFDTTTLTDKGGSPVTTTMVKEAIEKYVSAGTYHQLVIFFSGHGYWKNETELWLLSNAPSDANEAISWIETAEYAKDSGIPNVVLISDACRTIPGTKVAARVRGSIVFPNEDGAKARSKVDKFMAAAVARAAYEAKIDPARETTSIFTYCLLQAFKDPAPDTVDEITEDDERKFVVPNRKLGPFLRRKVPELLAKISLIYSQEPDEEVLSDADAYIGRAQRPPTNAHPELGLAPKPASSLGEVAQVALARELGIKPKVSPRKLQSVDILAKKSGFNLIVNSTSQAADVVQFETETGFAIIGSTVIEAASTMGSDADILDRGDGKRPGLVRMGMTTPACSVGLRFGNSRGSVLPALFGYIAHVQIENNAVVSVNYVPSQNNVRWEYYARRKDELERLRAVTNAAARKSVFRLADEHEAERFARAARAGKSMDPSLGLYASYAFLQADRREDIDSVIGYMESDLSATLFDIALLARRPMASHSRLSVVPFCPMLTQGWNLLRSRKVTLASVLNSAQDDLEPALWTTFKESSVVAILEAIRKGELQ